MCVNYVVERFMLISGLSPKEISDWIFLCSEACDHIERIRTDKKRHRKANDRRLINAAAVYAYYLYCQYAYEDLKSFKAGDVEVTRREGMLERAEKMWKAELARMRDVLSSDGENAFLFRRM